MYVVNRFHSKERIWVGGVTIKQLQENGIYDIFLEMDKGSWIYSIPRIDYDKLKAKETTTQIGDKKHDME